MTNQTERPLTPTSEPGDIEQPQPSQEKAAETKSMEYDQNTPGWPWDL